MGIANEELTGRSVYRDYTDTEMKRMEKELQQDIRYHPITDFSETGCWSHRLTHINLNTITEISLRLCRKYRKIVF